MTVTGGPRTPHSIVFEEGAYNFASASAISMGTNPITIKSGATLSINNQNVITATAGQALTLDGGTYRLYSSGAGVTIYTAGVATQMLLTSNGGTIYVPNSIADAGGGTPPPISPTVDDNHGSYNIQTYGTTTLASTIGLAPATASATLH